MKYTINHKQADIRLDKLLLSKYPNIVLNDIHKFIKKKEIKVNQKKVDFTYKVKKGDLIEFSDFIEKILENPTNKVEKPQVNHNAEKFVNIFKNAIIYEDENIIAINKPYGLSVQGDKDISIANIISFINLTENKSLKLVHRIDRTTTGILIIAKNLESSNALFKIFKNKLNITKKYIALVAGKPKNDSGIINYRLIKKVENGIEKVYRDDFLGKEATTKYNVIKYSKKLDISMLELQILTGRTHQIRVHLKELGNPILGDFKYNKNKNKLLSSNRIQLHSSSLELELFNKKIKINAPIPDQMQKIIDLF